MSVSAYENFDLFIEPTAQGYRARVIDSPVGQAAPVDFVLPFNQAELGTIGWLTGRALRQLRPASQWEEPGADNAPLTVQAFGTRLFDTVFGGGLRACLLRSLDAVEGQQKGLRIRLRLDRNAPELADLPWEYLYIRELARFPALSTETPLVRYIELPFAEVPLVIQPPLHMLVLVSAPTGAPPLDVEREWERLQRALADLHARNQVALHRLELPTLTALQRYLRRNPVHVLHFIGHGLFDEQTNAGVLLLETEDGAADVVSAAKLGTLLHDHDPLRLLFLNACEGARSGETDSFAGVAQHLVQQGIPTVIAMQFAVSDQAATTLSHEFYRALADNYPVDTALAEARKAVFLNAAAQPTSEAPADLTAEWGTPVLFSRSSDNRLLDIAQTADASESSLIQSELDLAHFEPETVPIPAGPFRMGSPPRADVPAHETPQSTIDLSAYRMGVYPVTNAQFAEFVRRSGRLASPQLGWPGQEPSLDQRNHPVAGVTFFEALDYCAWLREQTGRAYGLPHEAEWEKAARGTDGRLFPWGDAWEAGRCNHDGATIMPVDAFPAQSVYGCYDLVGNIREWTCTAWGHSARQPDARYAYPWADDGRNDPAVGPHLRRVYRGGAAADDRRDLRCSARDSYAPDRHGPPRKRHGFRVVLRLEE